MKANDIGKVTNLVNSLNQVRNAKVELSRANLDVIIRISGEVVTKDDDTIFYKDVKALVEVYAKAKENALLAQLKELGVEA